MTRARKIFAGNPACTANPYFSFQYRSEERNPATKQEAQVFRGAGISPAIFSNSTRREITGETLAPQYTVRHAYWMLMLINSGLLTGIRA